MSDSLLLATFADHDRARQARTDLLQAGLRDREVHIGGALDVVTSGEEAWVVPPPEVVYPEEAVRRLARSSAVAVVIAIVVMLPLALIDVGAAMGVRLVLFALLGGALGLAISAVVAPTPPRSPLDEDAAADTVLVLVERDEPRLRQLLLAESPVRLDEVAPDGTPRAALLVPDTDS